MAEGLPALLGMSCPITCLQQLIGLYREGMSLGHSDPKQGRAKHTGITECWLKEGSESWLPLHSLWPVGKEGKLPGPQHPSL